MDNDHNIITSFVHNDEATQVHLFPIKWVVSCNPTLKLVEAELIENTYTFLVIVFVVDNGMMHEALITFIFL